MGPRHLVLQEHQLEAGRCEEEAGKLERQGWRCVFLARETQCSEDEIRVIAGDVGRHFCCSAQALGAGWQSKELQDQGRLTMASDPIMGGITVFSVYFYHTGEWTERNQQLLEATSREILRCPGLWILAGDFNMEPEVFGQYATPARLPGFLVKPAAPTFRHGASVRCFDHFVVHRAVACQIREVRVLEGGFRPQPTSPGPDEAETFIPRVGRKGASDPESLATIIGCAREPRCWENGDEPWARLMQSTEQEILETVTLLGQRDVQKSGEWPPRRMGRTSCKTSMTFTGRP